ncbi:two-component regulator propeller domain-containing protein [Romboutsia sedimentorum]|uniref:histidine kinase n=1 Tax=Romboutsia sedimentorum TaxID=1368474 RepID=A0ABT7EAQ7_9FIRM|nr:sensor histidine kinase [Romboutsia sedimentorum]MDK2562585.1 two-component regulator propeller domain-containing protein [Romboutsia sedimentorum]MDK2584827.1 two-component regulator propeller domain-containing protein [Romboutsia sedimentorum]
MMRYNIIKIISVLTVILISKNNIVYGNEKINFDKISIKDGLSQGTVTCMMQDSENIVWIGTTDGLNKYNGYGMEIYKHEEENTNTIVSNYITDIEKDSYGNIWLSTDGGVSKINAKDYTIKNYTNVVDTSHMNKSSTTDILITKDKKIVVSTTQGINVYNEKKDKFEKLENNNIKNKYVYSMTQDDEENIWISTSHGLTKMSENFKLIKEFSNEEQLNINTIICKIYYDKKGYIWGGTVGCGLFKLDIKNNNVKNFTKNNNDKKALQCNYINDILKDKNGHMWLCTDDGIARYDEQSDNFKTYKNKTYDNYSLANDNTLSILEDKSGRIWIGTDSGISIFNYNNNIKTYSHDVLDDNTISANSIQSIYEDSDGLLWISTDKKGVDIINRNKDTVKHITSKEVSFFKDNNVNYITGSSNTIYLATQRGLLIIDKKLQSLKIYTKDDGLYNDFITTLLLDSNGYLWIATIDGINILNTKNNKILDIKKEYIPNRVDDKIIGSMFEDSEGDFYIGYIGNGGLVKLDVSENTYKYYMHDKDNKNSISCNSIFSINEDKDKNLWIGTSMGLNKFSKDSEKFVKYNSSSGLPNETIHGILIDNKNNLWISSNNGISNLDNKNNKLKNLSVLDGLQGNEFNQNAYYKNGKGEFFFGGTNGLNVFNPNEIKYNKLKSNLIIESFTVDDKKYKTIDKMNFKYTQNDIDINFYLPSYKNINQVKYYYKLQGPNYNKQWNSMNETKLIYSNLEPGNYTFKLKAKDYDGATSNEIKAEFSIKPPFYKSNIAIVIYILVILILIYRHKNKVKALDKLVTKKTNTLKKEIDANTELLNKTIELEQNKSNYFVNLSHELRTPLNVINATIQLADDSSKRNVELGMDKVEYHMNVINKNCKQLLSLIDNIIDSNKLDHDTYAINFEINEIVSIVEEVSFSLKDYVESKDILFIIDTDIEEKFIKCDRREIERCIINLIGNARKFTPAGGCIRVDIKDLGDKVEISISDSGIGIDEKYLEIIFNKFNQVLDMKKEAIKGGSGLGLTITKQIIDKHNGTIHVESELGKGSKFIIRLPIN